MTALARTRSNFKRQTRPLVREGAPHQQTRNCLTVIKLRSTLSKRISLRGGYKESCEKYGFESKMK
jgi:hypothetical protein